MPGGAREERLRVWVSRRLEAQRGLKAKLAKHLHRPASWVTFYLSRERDADLDTSIEIARFFRVPLTAILGDEPIPEPAESPIDAETARFVREITNLELSSELRAALLHVGRTLAREQQHRLARGSMRETETTARDRHPSSTHPRGRGSKGS